MTMTTRRSFLALALLASLPARAESSPAAPVTALDDGIIAVMKAARTTSFAQRAAMFTPVVQGAFDLPRIVRTSVGLQYASFSPTVQAELLDVFTQFTVASYAANFDDYNGERFEILPATRRIGADQVVVPTRIILGNGEPAKIDYVVRRESDTWKIVDVLLNGSISRVALQRSDFHSLLAGGTAEPLIASLRKKVAQLAAGHTG
jgi:phospholipid transport system substrate-binding protein